MLQGVVPEFLEPPPLPVAPVQVLPPALQIVLERPRLPRQPQQHVAGVLRVREHGLHHGLLQRVHAAAGLGVVPLLQRVEIGEHEVRGGRGLVEIGREADFESGLGERPGERGGERMRRVGSVHQQQRHLARARVRRQIGEILEGAAGRECMVGTEFHGLPHLARDIVEDVDGRDDLGAVGVLRRDASGDGETTARRGELAGEARDHLGLDPHRRGDPFGGIGIERGSHARHVRRDRREPAGDDHLRHREREHPLGARRGRDPLVGAHAGERQPRADVDELRHGRVAAPRERVGPREPQLVADGREPGLHEIGAERHDVARVGEVVPGNRGRAERDAIPGAQRLERERLVGHVPAADLPGPGVDQVAERPAFEPRDEGDALAAGFFHLGLQASQRIVPAELLPGAVRTARHRIGDPIGVVQALERRLPARAQAALVDGRLGVALELDHPALAHLGVHPAPGRALTTGGRVVGGDARDLILRRHEVGDELLGGLGADAAPRQRGGAAAGGAHDFQEPSAIHCVGPQ